MKLRRRLVLPPHARGMRIGLFGGTFNPPHIGHVMAARIAMRRLKLDRIWWMVSPGNPLKDNSSLPSVAARIAAARALIRDPRIIVTGLEADLRTHYTFDTLRRLLPRLPGVHCVWIMGGDGLAGFHQWGGWRRIARMIPMAIVDRPGATHRAVRAPAAQRFAQQRYDETDAGLIATARAPAWVFMHDRRSPLSSTLLRGGAGKSPLRNS